MAGAGFTDVKVTVDTLTSACSDVDQYWESIRGTGPRRIVDALENAQM